MRLALTIAFAAALLLPRLAAAGPAECHRLDRQIEHYQGMVERAQHLGSEMWEERTQDHVDLLMERRRAVGCPEPARDSGAARAFANLLRLAGRAALTYFTFGAF